MARLTKNTFAPINRVPPEVLSLIPDHRETDKELIRLTHVCRSWREIFISRASLWTFLGCENLDKTRAYLERSKTSSLEVNIWVRGMRCPYYAAFLLTIPHINRFKALSLTAFGDEINPFIPQLRSLAAPLLMELTVGVGPHANHFSGELFGGTLPSLCRLSLAGNLGFLPRQNLANLTTLVMRDVRDFASGVTKLLDIFGRAPLLHEIKLQSALPRFPGSDAPNKRMVSLPHLKLLIIWDEPNHSILLDHLHIPIGAMVILESRPCWQEVLPIPNCLPRSLDNLNNIIISIDLDFEKGVTLRLNGLSGVLYLAAAWWGRDLPSPTTSHHALKSLAMLPISTTEKLAISWHRVLGQPDSEGTAAYCTLLRMENLRTLTLAYCINRSFILALNPAQNTLNTVVCPMLEELVLHVRDHEDDLYIGELLEMARERASRGVKSPTIVIVNLEGRVSPEEALTLGSCVSCVEYKLADTTPIWDALPGETKIRFFDW